MKERKVMVYRKEVFCPTCKEYFDGYWQCPPEGFGYESEFYVCSSCEYLYVATIESVQYGSPIHDQVKSLRCVSCQQPLVKTLEKRSFHVQCPTCKTSFRNVEEIRNYDKDLEHVITAMDLY